MSSSVAALFDAKFDSIQNVILLNKNWVNQTGYFDYAVRLIELKEGEEAKSADQWGRKLIFIGTAFGTTVVFQRFTCKSDVLCWNATRELEKFMCMDHSHIDEWAAQYILGSVELSWDNTHEQMNIGERIKTQIKQISENLVKSFDETFPEEVVPPVVASPALLHVNYDALSDFISYPNKP